MISKTYQPEEIEDKIYSNWIANDCFTSVPDEREPYTIVIPPPNVTGVLHMGHMLNNTIQDILIRKARMQGFNACWVPGTDHASIATEAKVVQMLRERGIKKSDLSRSEFLDYAWEWKEKYGGIILEQLKKLGASCDWKRTRFTMEESLSEAVLDVFIDLHKKGLIYRGLRMINWDPQAQTTLSNEEVIHNEEQNQIYYIKYKVVDSEEFIVVATVRPETIMGDVAVCVNPNDERYINMVGKQVIVPLVNRVVPVIADSYVDMEFGTGALKITPAHDINDYEIGKKFNLPVVDCFNADGTIAPEAQVFVGMDRFAARKAAAKQLEIDEVLIKTETIMNKIGRSERTNAVVEPRLSMQWFVDMKKFMIKNPQVLQDVMQDEIRFFPSNLKNTYNHWIENIRDWCISRQLWWGQQIPAWYNKKGELVAVAKTQKEAKAIYKKETGEEIGDLKQDEDVVDTWFSSWLWPISVFDGFKDPDNQDINYYYPTNDLVTAPEIMFFWVMRMIMSGYEWKGEKPFKNVYYTGIVRDKLRRKMSKSLGNSPDPLELIAKYGADGVRVGMLLCSPAGNDILFDEKLVEQGRNFANKIWNAYRLIDGWEVDKTTVGDDTAVKWMTQKLNEINAQLNIEYKDYRLSEALKTLYSFVWDDFCSWYLEMIKPAFGAKISSNVYIATVDIFEQILGMLHPFMPFISEEIWQELRPRKAGDFLCISSYPTGEEYDKQHIADVKTVLMLISEVRNLKAQKQVSPKEIFDCIVPANNIFTEFKAIIEKLAAINIVDTQADEGFISFMVNTDECFIKMASKMDVKAEKERILKEIDYNKGFKESVMRKLQNEKFVSSAPAAVVDVERKKLADTDLKIDALTKALEQLN